MSLFCHSTMLFTLLWLYSIICSLACDTTPLLFLCSRVFAFQGHVCFPVNFRIDFPIREKQCWNCYGYCIESIDASGSLAILTIIILTIHEYRRSFHLLVFFIFFKMLVLFIQVFHLMFISSYFIWRGGGMILLLPFLYISFLSLIPL